MPDMHSSISVKILQKYTEKQISQLCDEQK